jgi:hypothetical protein
MAYAHHCCDAVSCSFPLSASRFQSSPVSILVQLTYLCTFKSHFLLLLSYNTLFIHFLFYICVPYILTIFTPFPLTYFIYPHFFPYFISFNNLESYYCNFSIHWCKTLYWGMGNLPFGMLSSQVCTKIPAFTIILDVWAAGVLVHICDLSIPAVRWEVGAKKLLCLPKWSTNVEDKDQCPRSSSCFPLCVLVHRCSKSYTYKHTSHHTHVHTQIQK